MDYIKKTYLKEIEISELDFDNQDEILGKNQDGHNFDWIVTENNDSYWMNEAQEINIDQAIKILETLKDLGSNYVEIMHYGDHHGYAFNGLKMCKATKKEINFFKKEVKEFRHAIKENRIKELKQQLENLKRS